MDFEGMSCRTRCWAVAAACGFLLAVILWLAIGYTFLAGLFIGVLVALLIGMVAIWAVCEGEGAERAADGAAATRSAPTARAAGDDAAPGSPRARSESAASEGDAANGASAPPPAAGDTTASTGEASRGARSARPTPGAAAESHAAEAAEREGAGAGETTARASAAAEAGAAVAPEGPAAAGAGTRPETLSAPRGGAADDLKAIRGVGPKLEQQLNEMGIYHLDQIAGWREEEVAWVDENLPGFRGRVSRDDWVGQARALGPGG